MFSVKTGVKVSAGMAKQTWNFLHVQIIGGGDGGAFTMISDMAHTPLFASGFVDSFTLLSPFFIYKRIIQIG